MRLESTRNEPNKLSANSARVKQSIVITPISRQSESNNNNSTNEEMNTEEDGGNMPVIKRKRKSTLQNEENANEKEANTLKPLSVN